MEKLDVENIKVIEAFKVWVVYTNSDLTEGRGTDYPIFTCASEATANRLAKKRGVMGSDARVHESTVVRLNTHKGTYMSDINIQYPTLADEASDKVIKEARAKSKLKEVAIEKAKALGLSEEDIKALKGD